MSSESLNVVNLQSSAEKKKIKMKLDENEDASNMEVTYISYVLASGFKR